MPKYEVWWQSTTDHCAIIEADNLDHAESIGVWEMRDSGDYEFKACDTEWEYVGVNLVDGE